MLILRTFLSYIELIQLSMLGISLADSTFLDGFDYGKNRWWWDKLKINIISIKERRHSHGWWDIRGEKSPPPQPLKAGDCILLHHLEANVTITNGATFSLNRLSELIISRTRIDRHIAVIAVQFTAEYKYVTRMSDGLAIRHILRCNQSKWKIMINSHTTSTRCVCLMQF